MNKWQYGVEYNPEDYFGFVYKITNLTNGKFYIGKKFFSRAATKQIKGKKKKIRKMSDWESYYGSNKVLMEEIEKEGKENYKREIIKLCINRAECSYWEMYYIFVNDALLSESFYNEWASVKIRKKHLIKK